MCLRPEDVSRTVTAMKVNGRPLPNNPKQAYMLGKLHGTQDTMGNVAMVLLDKCGWHIKMWCLGIREGT